MADSKISNLPASTTPLAGTEVLPIVQSSSTKQVSVANLTAGRDVSANIFISAAGTVSAPSITTTADLNTGIYFPSADAIGFAEGGAEAMRIDASSNVGIGTSSPVSRLQVANVYTNTSDATIVASAGIPGINFRSSAGSRMSIFTNYAAANTTSFLTGVSSANPSSEVLRFNHTSGDVSMAAGNFGIGTNSPNASALLDVQSTTKGVRMPNMTTVQKNAIASPTAGLMVYDTTLSKLCVYTTAWETITSI